MKINDPTDVLFNDRSINVDKIDSIEIFNNCDCLKFNNFTFNKQPFVSEVINAKTIFSRIRPRMLRLNSNVLFAENL